MIMVFILGCRGVKLKLQMNLVTFHFSICHITWFQTVWRCCLTCLTWCISIKAPTQTEIYLNRMIILHFFISFFSSVFCSEMAQRYNHTWRLFAYLFRGDTTHHCSCPLWLQRPSWVQQNEWWTPEETFLWTSKMFSCFWIQRSKT